jgi:hypothetical protein
MAIFDKKKFYVFSSVNFYKFLVIKTLDPDPGVRIGSGSGSGSSDHYVFNFISIAKFMDLDHVFVI